jgi:hypothetical protein
MNVFDRASFDEAHPWFEVKSANLLKRGETAVNLVKTHAS